MTVKTYAPEDVRIVIGGIEIPSPCAAESVSLQETHVTFDLGVHYASRYPARLLPAIPVRDPERKGARS